jgi:sugar lactone lactonase YvrE
VQTAPDVRACLLKALLVSASIGVAACGGGGGGGGAANPIGPAPPPAPAPTPTPAPPNSAPPTVATQPLAQTVGAGSPGTFAVASLNATSFQWQRSSDAGATWFDVAGATAATLTLPPTALIDSGAQFRVILTNSVGSTTSSAAALTVRPYLRLLAGALGGHGFQDAQGAVARFDFTRGSAVDPAGSVYVADGQNHVIRRVTPSGMVTTVAGTPGEKGRVDGPATSARLASPRDVAIDAAGTLWFVDQGTCYLRKIAGGTVTSVARMVLGFASCYNEDFASSGYDPAELAVSPSGDIYVSDRQRNIILRVDPAGTVTLFAGSPDEAGSIDGPRLSARFSSPRGLVFDAAGNLYVADSHNGLIRRIDPSGAVTTLAGNAQDRSYLDGVGLSARLLTPVGLALVGNHWLAVTDISAHTVRVLDLMSMALTTIAGSLGNNGSADGAGTAARFDSPYGISSNLAGDFLVSDSGNSTVRRVTLAGTVTTLAGQPVPSGHIDGTGPAARFQGAHPLVSDPAGNIYVADATSATIRKITPAGVVTTLAGSPGQIGLVDGAGGAARFNFPRGLAIDSAGNIIVADTGNDAIRRVTPDGIVSTVSGLAGRGHVDGPAAMARFYEPVAIAIDPSGNIFIADQQNCLIRKITPGGTVSTFAGLSPYPCAALDGPGGIASVAFVESLVAVGVDDVIFTEGLLFNPTRLRRARSDGSIATVAGSSTSGNTDGDGVSASFAYISGLVADRTGNVYVADAGNNAVRLMRPNHSVATLIGKKPPANTSLGDAPVIRHPGGIALLPGNALAVSSEAAILVD